MKIKLSKEQGRKILFWCILLCIAPFALEVVIMAEFVGAELALYFLTVYIRDLYFSIKAKLIELHIFVREIILILNSHPAFNPKVYSAHATTSMALVLFGMPLMYVAVVWYPVIITGHAWV